MLVLAWVMSIVCIFMLGYFLNTLGQKIKGLQEAIKDKMDKKPEPTPNKSSLYDPYSVRNRTKAEHDALMQKLNG